LVIVLLDFVAEEEGPNLTIQLQGLGLFPEALPELLILLLLLIQQLLLIELQSAVLVEVEELHLPPLRVTILLVDGLFAVVETRHHGDVLPLQVLELSLH